MNCPYSKFQSQSTLFMRSKLTDWELSVIILIISIFTIKPISLRPNPQNQSRIDIFQAIQCQLDRSKLTSIG
jgi:hypothetical protein